VPHSSLSLIAGSRRRSCIPTHGTTPNGDARSNAAAVAFNALQVLFENINSLSRSCLLALVESIAKRMVLLNDKVQPLYLREQICIVSPSHCCDVSPDHAPLQVFGEVVAFLDACALHGDAFDHRRLW
jgi:hypothetical protein